MGFEIAGCSKLTQAQCAEIEALQKSVYDAEGLQNGAWLSNEINFDRSVPCFFLGYADGALVSFLTLFLPTRQEGEVTAFTAIDQRGKGYFTALLRAAGAVLAENHVPNFLFALESKSETGMAYLQAHFPQAVHSHTEYRMFREPDVQPLAPHMTVRPVTQENLEDFMAVSVKEYGGDRMTVEAVLTSELRRAYLVYDGTKPVGVFELADGEALTLCGVAVAEEERGKGYGNTIVRAALNFAAEAGKRIELDVDSGNPPALGLYRKFGFRPTFEVQYWRAGIPIQMK
ncbi:MAG: GNAT family N-acetyltransferase [Hominenteromicrobium sp.]